ncbi:UNVERIFIED_CONTAM: hypothetical protein K2H54_055045 [Gekko kuhli]
MGEKWRSPSEAEKGSLNKEEVGQWRNRRANRGSALQESLNQNFMLIVTHREVQREYNLNFSGSSTIQEQ